jgi:hypothetical protein
MNDSTTSTVTLYRANKLDAEYQATPDELAAQFVKALQDPAYKPSGRPSVEFEYRWWLSGPEATGGANSSWAEQDSAALLDGLRDFLDAEPDAKAVVLKAVFGEA